MQKKSYIGLACTGHDNALAIVNSEGKIVFAEATERYLQNKRAVNTPPDDVFRTRKLIEEYCDKDSALVMAKTWSSNVQAIMGGEQCDHIAKQITAYQNSNQLWSSLFPVYHHLCSVFVPSNVDRAGQALKFYCQNSKRDLSVRYFDHHLTHAATGCYTSPYHEAVCASIDGFGEGTSVSFYAYREGAIHKVDHAAHPPGGMESLGFFYGLIICGLCGFNAWEGEEWKVMGLAPYGKLNKEMYAAMQRFIQVDGFRLIHPDTAEEACQELLAYARKPGSSPLTVADLAFTGQQYFADIMTQLLDQLYALGISDNLVLGGGCALNSSYNGMILERTQFKSVHVYSAPADDGNAVGAALLAYYEDHPEQRPIPAVHTPYLGSEVSRETLTHLQQLGRIKGLVRLEREELYQRTAAIIAEGKICGWVQGRAEYGPRSLGNRSILADPRRADMKDRINGRVKFREEFRPFAPSILHEFGDEYFIDYQETPYMERTLLFRDGVKERVPAVVHANSSGRLQTVKKEWNEPYYRVISEFHRITGIPILLNTSLNVMGKPIIHSVEDAIALFFTTGLDAMVIEDYLILKD